jgi:hypothetical protein
MDQHFKCRFFSPSQKGLQELAVRHGFAIFKEHGFANLPYCPAQVAGAHGMTPFMATNRSLILDGR